jgi:regulator of nonsense transcripts 1
MADPFANLGNHLVSDSVAAIRNGTDDLSAIDPQEALIYRHNYSGRRRADDADDDDDATADGNGDLYDGADSESLASLPMDGLAIRDDDDEESHDHPLPEHACA